MKGLILYEAKYVCIGIVGRLWSLPMPMRKGREMCIMIYLINFLYEILCILLHTIVYAINLVFHFFTLYCLRFIIARALIKTHSEMSIFFIISWLLFTIILSGYGIGLTHYEKRRFK